MAVRVAPSETLEAAIAGVLAERVGTGERLGELGRLGARLILQRAVEEEAAEFLQRAPYERTPAARGSRNGVRPRRIQTAEGELAIAVPQLRNTAEQFVSTVLPDSRMALRTRPLETLIIGAYVRGSRTGTSRAWSLRPGWGPSRRARSAGSVASSRPGTAPSGPARWAGSTCW